MKPRTKEQKHVLQLSKQLKPISEAAKRYAYEHCFEDIGLYKKNGWVCNQNSPRHEDIVRLVTNYMPLLRKTACTAK